MKYCTSCGSELPVAARFCGMCGKLISSILNTPTGISGFNEVDLLQSDARTFISDPAYPTIASDQLNRLDATMRRTIAEDDRMQPAPSTEERDDVMFDPLIWGAQAGNVQGPGGNVPMVHGTPYIHGVPVVPGTPSVPGTPGGQGLYQGAPSPAAPQVPPLAQHPLSNQPLTGQYPSNYGQLPQHPGHQHRVGDLELPYKLWSDRLPDRRFGRDEKERNF